MPPDLQGRVFATRGLIATISVPVSQIIAGPLADGVMEPLMMNATGLPEALFGSGDGAGMAVIIFITGVLGIVVGLAGYVFRNVREVETLMPDHVVAKTSEEGDGEPPSIEEASGTPERELESEQGA